MKCETRTFRNMEVRAVDELGPNGRPVVELRAIRPFVVDDYGSVWMPDTFDTLVGGRIAADPDDTPALCWHHRWDDPIAHGIAFNPDAAGPLLRFELDDFDAVPRAKQADAQVRSKTIRDCSVGFFNTKRRDPTDSEKEMWPGVREVIYEADLDEVSLVLRGAVPGAKVLAIRSAGGEVGEDAWLAVARKVAAGDLTVAEGKAALALAAEDGDQASAGEPDPDADAEDDQEPAEVEETEPPAPALPDVLDEDEAELAGMTERSR